MARLHFTIKLSSEDAFKLKAQALNDDPRLKQAGIGALKFGTDKQFIAGGEILPELPPEPAPPPAPRNTVKIKLSSDYAYKLKAQALNDDPRLKQAGIGALKFGTEKHYIAGGEFHSELPPPAPATTDSSGNKKGDGGTAQGEKTRITIRVDRNTAYALKAEQLNENPRLKEVGISDFKLKKNQRPAPQPEVKRPQPEENLPQPIAEQNTVISQFQPKVDSPQPIAEQVPQPEVKPAPPVEAQPQPIETPTPTELPRKSWFRRSVKQPQPTEEQVPQAEVAQPQPIEAPAPTKVPRKSWFRRSEKQPQPIAEQEPQPVQKPGIIRRFFRFVWRLIKWAVVLVVIAALVIAALAIGDRINFNEIQFPALRLPDIQQYIDEFRPTDPGLVEATPAISPTETVSCNNIPAPTSSGVMLRIINYRASPVELYYEFMQSDDPFPILLGTLGSGEHLDQPTEQWIEWTAIEGDTIVAEYPIEEPTPTQCLEIR